MILETRFGTLDLPDDHCVECIATGIYMYCTRCDYKWGLMEDAAAPAQKRRDEIQKWIDEHKEDK